MKIKNADQLAVTDERKSIIAIAEAGLEAIDTTEVVNQLLRVDGDSLFVGTTMIDLKPVEKLVFIAVGKCSSDAAVAAEHIVGGRITRGVMIDVKACPVLNNIKSFCGTHPLPSDGNLEASEAVVEALTGLTERDVVIFVISGGGSTLLFLPEDKKDRDEKSIVQALMNAGATIRETNTVRKHLSLARGGYLAQYAYPARLVSLIFSDVVGDDLSLIASGPTVKDITTVDDAAEILAKFNILMTCNIEKCGLVETPKEDKYFEHAINVLAVSNHRALEAMEKTAKEKGFHVEIRGTELQGEASEVARMVAESLHAAPGKTVLLWGGETTVTVRGKGRGGRNLELAASALSYIKADEIILSLATDGKDNGAFAGALCDTITKEATLKAGLDVETFRAESNLYPLFEAVGNYVLTGDTGSNVSDIIIALKK